MVNLSIRLLLGGWGKMDKDMEQVKQILAKDRFAIDAVGIELVEVEPGRAVVRLEVGEKHLNGLGIMQGGAIFTLADYALAAAANSHGMVAVTISATISYFRAVSTGTLLAEAIEESFDPKLATYTVRVTNAEKQLIALVQSTVYRKNIPLCPG